MRSRPPLEGFQLVFVACWALLGILLLGLGAFSLFPARVTPFGSAELSLFIAGVLFLFIALFYARAWFGYRAVVGLAGIVLALYGVVLVLIGTPYVGGLIVAVPGAVICVGLGVWSLLLVVAEPSRARAGAG